jgi:type IV secretion system protein VirD4
MPPITPNDRRADGVSGIYLGRYVDPQTGARGTDLFYRGDRHLLLFGPTGSGKSKRLIINNLLRLQGRSLVVLDPKGELVEKTAAQRGRFGDVVVLNPFNMHGAGSAGFNPLASLDPDSDTFVDDVMGLGEALIRVNPEAKEPHWEESAQNLVVGLIMWEVQEARRERRAALLTNVRMMLTEAEEDDKDKEPVKGLRATAKRACKAGGAELESFLARFAKGNADEIASIKSTADRQTAWMLSRPMGRDLTLDGINFADLKRKPTTVYVVLPAQRFETHSAWLRLVIVTALQSLFNIGGVPTTFVIDEFALLGRLKIIERAFGVAREFGVQVWPVLQDLNQLKELYDKKWETFVGNAGVVQGFAPNDMTTAEWMSKRAGDTTVVAKGYNQGGSSGVRGESSSDGFSYQQIKRPLFLPQDLMNLGPGCGVIWPDGTAKTIPFFAPFYWEM